jgi:hypothetical protein
MSWEEVQAEFARDMKVRLKEDLIDHLGDELLTVQDMNVALDEDEDAASPFAAIEGTCFAIQLRNGRAFGESLEKMLRSRGLHASRKTEDYQGLKLHSMRLAGLVEVEYAVADDMLVISIGSDESSKQSMRSVLDASANPAAVGELPTAVKDLVGKLPAGWSGLSAMPMFLWFEIAASLAEFGYYSAEGIEQMPELEHAFEMVRAVGGELERYGLKTMVSTNYSRPNRFTVRYLW